jgi:hypothetical protein
MYWRNTQPPSSGPKNCMHQASSRTKLLVLQRYVSAAFRVTIRREERSPSRKKVNNPPILKMNVGYLIRPSWHICGLDWPTQQAVRETTIKRKKSITLSKGNHLETDLSISVRTERWWIDMKTRQKHHMNLIFVLFVHQCSIHFLLFIIRRHVSASHGHLQLL